MVESRANRFPTQQQDQAPQSRASKSPEREPRPRVLDILERRAQLYESVRVRAPYGQKPSRERRAVFAEFREKREQLGNELATLYEDGTDSDRLILDVYTTLAKTSTSQSVNWSLGLSARETRQFISRVEPMTDGEIAEELSKAQEALERKTAISKKISETHRLNKSLSPQERYGKQREKDRERSRAYQRRKREGRLQVEKQKPTQVFPPPTQE